MRKRVQRMIAVLLGSLALPAAAVASGGKPPSTPPPTVTIQWVGDMALSTQRGLPPGGVYNALAPVRGFLTDADIDLGNLEGTLSIGGASKCGGAGGGGGGGGGAGGNSCFAFQAP